MLLIVHNSQDSKSGEENWFGGPGVDFIPSTEACQQPETSVRTARIRYFKPPNTENTECDSSHPNNRAYSIMEGGTPSKSGTP